MSCSSMKMRDKISVRRQGLGSLGRRLGIFRFLDYVSFHISKN
jgi:hypothetical protein